MKQGLIATNRAARRDYEILESVEAGIQLLGSEVKSLRIGRANLKDSFARIDNGEIYLCNCHISPYEQAGRDQADPIRMRKLLLKKGQIIRLTSQVQEKSMALIPLKLYFKNGYAKVDLALAKGKRQYDKREKIKHRTTTKEINEKLF